MVQTIMLVENQPDLREVTGLLLASSGYDVITEPDAAEALDLIHKRSIDLVITEIKLPVMNGNQFIKELGQMSNPPPVLVLTKEMGQVEPNPLIKEILQKPFIMTQLRQMVLKAISHP